MSSSLEKVFSDLLNAKIDESQNILGNRWLERGTFATLIGSSGTGKSVAAMQTAILAAAGLPVFGIEPAHPLKVVLVQSEDSRNDRIDEVQCARVLVPEELYEETDGRLTIYNTTDERGAELFRVLEGTFNEDPIDLFLFNPAFAFFDEDASVEESSDVGRFLRSELQPFLQRMRAAGIIIHHTPKLTHRNTEKWSTHTWMYSGHGSAEWTNAPRGVIVIEGTKSADVFEFIVSKRGSKTGWEKSPDGGYSRYFSHAGIGQPMHWKPATEDEIAAAKRENAIGAKDVMDLFTDDAPEWTVTPIKTRLKEDGLFVTDQELDRILNNLHKKGKLHRVGAKFIFAKKVKNEEKAKQKEQRSAEQVEQNRQGLETVFTRIKESMPDGVLLGELTETGAFPFGKDSVKKYLTDLEGQERIRVELTKKGIVEFHRYFTK